MNVPVASVRWLVADPGIAVTVWARRTRAVARCLVVTVICGRKGKHTPSSEARISAKVLLMLQV